MHGTVFSQAHQRPNVRVLLPISDWTLRFVTSVTRTVEFCPDGTPQRGRLRVFCCAVTDISAEAVSNEVTLCRRSRCLRDCFGRCTCWLFW